MDSLSKESNVINLEFGSSFNQICNEYFVFVNETSIHALVLQI